MAGDVISMSNGKLTVPNEPIIPFIEGDGTGPDIWRASVRVFDEATKRSVYDKQTAAAEAAAGIGIVPGRDIVAQGPTRIGPDSRGDIVASQATGVTADPGSDIAAAVAARDGQ